MDFVYGEEELNYLRKKDKRLGEAIDKIGHINLPIEPDLFSSVIYHIVGQQISMAAQKTVWQRVQNMLGEVNVGNVCAIEDEKLQSVGISFRKVGYIKDFAQKVKLGEFDVESLNSKSDDEIVKELSSLNGIGIWTAEMLMIFSMGRQDVLSFGDLAIQRGLKMLYHHRKIDKKLFEKYRKRYRPYNTVASLYLWKISNGAMGE